MILGGGFGGIAAARALEGRLGSRHEVALIDRNRTAHLCGMNPMLIVGERDPRKVGRSLSRLARRGIDVVQAEIRRIETGRREVATDRGTFPYDYLVVALGADYDWAAVPGSAAAHSFYSFDEARRLRRRLSRFRRGRVVIAVAGVPYKCPPAPFETALLLHWAFRERGIRRDVDLHVYISEPAPLAVAGPEASARMRADLAGRGIELHTGAAVTEVAPSSREASFADGSSIDADVIATIPIHRVPEVVAEAGLTNGKPWVPVDPATLETSVPAVFAIGDVNAVPFAEGRALPKAGVFAAGEGQTVGELIAARIDDVEPPRRYDGSGECFLAYTGAQAGMVGGTFLAPGGPAIALRKPTASGMRRKERFEEDWRQFRI